MVLALHPVIAECSDDGAIRVIIATGAGLAVLVVGCACANVTSDLNEHDKCCWSKERRTYVVRFASGAESTGVAGGAAVARAGIATATPAIVARRAMIVLESILVSFPNL